MPPSPLRVPIVVPPEGAEELPVSDIQHVPLQDSAEPIRLLKIHPLERHQSRQGFNFYQPLHCSIVEVKLCENPIYDALSYVWGDPRSIFPSPRDNYPASRWQSRPFRIFCDGKPLSIGCNLWVALLTLRWFKSGRFAQGETTFSDYIWIDAVCINQSDLIERSRQVLQMSRIYGQAKTVQVWLGGEDRFTNEGVEAFYSLRQLFSHLDSATAVFSRADCSKIPKDINGKEGYLSTEDWSSLAALLCRSWFQRAWVCQEACLATTISFWIGGRIIPGKVLLAVLWLLVKPPFDFQISDHLARCSTILAHSKDRTRPLDMPTPRMYCRDDKVALNFNTIALVIQHSMYYGDLRYFYREGDFMLPQPLLGVLVSGRGTLATDPRDKVLAFLSLCSEYQPNRRLKQRLDRLVDYTQTTADMYTETARVILTSMKGKLFLLECKEPFPTYDLPSWVPDFSVPWQSILFAASGSANYESSKSLRPARVRFPSPVQLALQGVLVSKMNSLIKMKPFYDAIYNALSLLKQLPKQTRVIYPGEQGDEVCWQPAFEVLWRTLLGDYCEDQHPAPAKVGSTLISYLQEFWKMRAVYLLIRALPDMVPRITEVDSRLGQHCAEISEKDGISQELLSKELDEIAMTFTIWRTFACPDIEFEGELMYPPELDILKNVIGGESEPEENLVFTGLPTTTTFEFVIGNLMEFYAEKADPLRDEVLSPLRERSLSRQLGTTEDGHLGIFPVTSQIGDSLWVVAGASMPLVLRGNSHGSWRLVGEAYVHGIMHGEAVSTTTTLEEVVIS